MSGGIVEAGCDAKCWRQVRCAVCLHRKQPRGRSVPPEAANSYCDHDCPGYDQEPVPPHLWDEHDSNRAYSDPAGWAAHMGVCEMCGPEREPLTDITGCDV
jgi:hypothetical protein